MRYLPLFLLVFFVGACVPKQRYEDQEARLKDVQEKLRVAEQHASECDPNTFIQLKEQSQSLDLLTQELVDRNTELSKEVARLRSVETSCRTKDQEYGAKLNDMEKDHEAKIERLRRTYEDLVKELRAQIIKLEADLKEKAAPAPSAGGGGKGKGSKAPANPAKKP